MMTLGFLFALAPLAHADPAHELPPCEDFPAAAGWERAAERGFRFALPPGAQADPRMPSLDHEFGRWTWSDGRQLLFQYGFAVTELADWLDESFVTGCRADLDGVAAVLLERRDPNGSFAWAIGLFDYVHSFTASEVPGEQNPPLANDLAIIGSGSDDSVFAQGRAVFDSFRWSRMPAAALMAWSVEGAANNGVLVFETHKGATGLMFATYRDGKPYWLVGASPGPVMSYRQSGIGFGDHEATAVSVPLTLYETANGVVPGEPDHPADIAVFAEAELSVSLDEGCTRAQLRYVEGNGSEATTLALVPTYPLLQACSEYRD